MNLELAYREGVILLGVSREGVRFRDRVRKLQINAGDIGLFYASLRHGLNTIDQDNSPDVKKKDGRWWFGLNVHNSNEIDESKRHTTSPYKISKNI